MLHTTPKEVNIMCLDRQERLLVTGSSFSLHKKKIIKKEKEKKLAEDVAGG